MMWHRPASIFTCAIVGALLVFLAGDGASSSAAQPGRTAVGPAPPSFIRLAAPASGDAAAGAPQAAGEEGLLVGDLPSEGGIGLVLWSGGAASALAEAARALGCNVAAVYANDLSGGLIRYLPNAPRRLLNREFHAAYPNGLPPSSPVIVECAAPGAPRIAFLGDVPADRQWEIRTEIERVQTFFSERWGIRVPDFRVYLSDHESPYFAEIYPPGLHFPPIGLASAEGIFINGVDKSFGDNTFRWMFAHEYSHVWEFQANPQGSPRWLSEGMAEYAAVQYMHHVGQTSLYDGRLALSVAELLWVTAHHTDNLSKLDEDNPVPYYNHARLAVELLIAWYGDDLSYAEYWRQRATSDTWQEAFEAAFGVDFDEFQERYRTYRRSVYGQIHIQISGLENTRLEDRLHLAAHGLDPPHYGSTFNVRGDEASVRVTEGDYAISAYTRILVDGIDLGQELGLYNKITGTLGGGCALGESHNSIRVRRGAVIHLSIDIPRYYMFQATLLDGNGPPPYDVSVKLYGLYGLASTTCPHHPLENGKLFAHVPDGSSFTLRVTADGRDIGWWNGDGFTADQAQAKTLTLRGADLTGVEIRLPATPDGK